MNVSINLKLDRWSKKDAQWHYMGCMSYYIKEAGDGYEVYDWPDNDRFICYTPHLAIAQAIVVLLYNEG